MAFSSNATRSSSEGPVGFYLCLAYFEALDPLSCLPFEAHYVKQEVTGRAVSLAAFPPAIHSFFSAYTLYPLQYWIAGEL